MLMTKHTPQTLRVQRSRLPRRRVGTGAAWLLLVASGGAFAQVLVKSASGVDSGGVVDTGTGFVYRLDYHCASAAPCLDAELVDLLPAGVEALGTLPATPAGDVALIATTPNFMGSARTRVRFVLVSPLPAGSRGTVQILARFPNGATPHGTLTSNTADGINLGAIPGTYTTPALEISARAALRAALEKTLTSAPANLDQAERYRLRIANPDTPATLTISAVDGVVDTLPPGTVFNGATPAADCEPGCVGTTPATLTWTSPCAGALAPGQSCDITVNVTFPSASYPSGSNVTNSFSAMLTPLGGASTMLGPATLTHAVTSFVPAPAATLAKPLDSAAPNPPALGQDFSYRIRPANSGNVQLDNLVVIDTLPVALQVTRVTTGAYSGVSDFAFGEGVRVSYEKNTAPGVFTLWGSSPGVATNTTLNAPPPGLGAGEYITRIRWEYGNAQPGMAASTAAEVRGRIINPGNAGAPVSTGDSIQNCADLSALYAAGPTNINRNACTSFTLAAPFVQLAPLLESLSGTAPLSANQASHWRLRLRNAEQASAPMPLEDLVVSHLLPSALGYVGWTFDDRGTGHPAPQSFTALADFAGTGRTLLRWRWNGGSGNLGIGQEVWINLATSVASPTTTLSASHTLALDSDAAGLALRCSGSSAADALDQDGDLDSVETLCTASASQALHVPPPIASDVTLTLAANSAATPVPLAISGASPATAVSTPAGPANGTLDISGTSLSYTPATGFSGSDSFTYVASNAGGSSLPAAVDVVVTAAPTPTPTPTPTPAPTATPTPGPTPSPTPGPGDPHPIPHLSWWAILALGAALALPALRRRNPPPAPRG